MAIVLPKDIEFADNPHVSMDWPVGYFVTQGTNFFHGAAINYKNNDTVIGVAFGREGTAYVGFNESDELMTAEELMNFIIEIARDQAYLVEQQQYPEDTLDDIDELTEIYIYGEEAETFNEALKSEFSEEDLKDIEKRLEDLSIFDETEEFVEEPSDDYEEDGE